MVRKVRNCCKTCENLACVATIIGQLQHTEYLKPTFLDTSKWAIRPVFLETVTYDDHSREMIKIWWTKDYSVEQFKPEVYTSFQKRIKIARGIVSIIGDLRYTRDCTLSQVLTKYRGKY